MNYWHCKTSCSLILRSTHPANKLPYESKIQMITVSILTVTISGNKPLQSLDFSYPITYRTPNQQSIKEKQIPLVSTM
uniref:Uncharacterized protein n=1 Tax=Arundo donax TaxID=35708 RepID=A0A0A9CJ45_ARUDO